MKAVILQADLNKWLSVVGRVVPSRGQLPVLANVLIEADKEGLVLSGTNLEIGLKVVAGGKVMEKGAITVPAKILGEFVGSLLPGNVTLAAEGEKLKVEGGKLSAVFAGIAAAEFPVITKGEERKGIKIKKQMVEEVATQVAYAAAGDESRPILTGVRFEATGQGLVVVATDGFRLSRKIIKTGAGVKQFEKGLVLPARTLVELARIAGEGKKEEIEMAMAEESNQAVFGYDGVWLTSRILEGNFPDVSKIIPEEGKIQFLVEREDLVRAVRAVGVFARESSNVIRFKVGEGGLGVEASSAQMGEGRDEIEIEMEKGKGEEAQIAFNYRYIQDFLNSVTGGRIRFRMNDSLSPGVWEMEKDESLVHLIMPVRV